MRCVEISEAQAHLLQLIDELERGDEILLLLRNGQPVAKLVLIQAGPGKRIGVAKGKFEASDDIDTNSDDVKNQFSR